GAHAAQLGHFKRSFRTPTAECCDWTGSTRQILKMCKQHNTETSKTSRRVHTEESSGLTMGELKSSSVLRGILTVEVGIRNSSLRNGKQRNITVIPEEGFAVFREKVKQQLNSDDKSRTANVTENGAIFSSILSWQDISITSRLVKRTSWNACNRACPACQNRVRLIYFSKRLYDSNNLLEYLILSFSST
ncbi:hypothetical protein JG687_00015872, partial [Phytophthora cactorum]